MPNPPVVCLVAVVAVRTGADGDQQRRSAADAGVHGDRLDAHIGIAVAQCAPAGRKKPGAHPPIRHKNFGALSPTAIALLEKKEAELQAVQVGADVTAADDAEPSESPVVDASRADDAGVGRCRRDGTGAG